MWTPSPPTLPSIVSTSPVWTPARTSMPSGLTASRIASAHSMRAPGRRTSRRTRRQRCRPQCHRADAARHAPPDGDAPGSSVSDVAELRRMLRRAHDVREQDRGEESVEDGPCIGTSSPTRKRLISSITVPDSPTQGRASSQAARRASHRGFAQRGTDRFRSARWGHPCDGGRASGREFVGRDSRRLICRNIRVSPMAELGVSVSAISVTIRRTATGSPA